MTDTQSKSDIREEKAEGAEAGAAIVLVIQDAKASISLCSSCQKCLAHVCKPNYRDHYAFLHRYQHPDLPATYNSPLHNSYQSWDDAVRAGCWICCKLQEYIPAPILAGWAKTRTIRDAIMYSAEVYDDKPFSLSITAGHYRMGLAIRRSLDTVSKTATLDIGTTSNSTSAWNTIFKWLNDCIHEHESCTKLVSLGDTKWYPTRLLDLGDPSNKSRKVNILETTDKKLEGYYITLSHCWGDGRHLQLTKENKAALLNEILAFPKTFAEAISACRKLELRYLWIDSLCIIQDDIEDWTREAALMHRIYRNAWCNIAAVASRNSSEGLFREREANTIGELVIDLEGTGRFGIADERLFVFGLDSSPLQKRAWVLQERLLSQRILHFGESQVFWECSQLTACESFPDGLPKGMTNDEIRKIFNNTISDNPTTSWNSIVENYTKRDMTYTSDKLPALSGVANALSTILGGKYLAGIWNNENLLYQLAWSTSGPTSSLRPRPDYRAPTWSWASVDDQVNFWHKRDAYHSTYTNYRTDTEIVEAHVDPIGTDETSAVRNGFLLLQGYLKCVAQPRKNGFDRAFNLQFDTCDEVVGDLFFLRLFTEIIWKDTRYGDIDWDHFGHYLILVRHPYHPNGYRRVGFATTFWYTTDDPNRLEDDEDDPETIFLKDIISPLISHDCTQKSTLCRII